MKKAYLLLLFLSCWSLVSFAQVSISGGETLRTDSIAKKILEPTQYVASYGYRYVPNPEMPEVKKEGLTLLQVGQRYVRFADYYKLQADSLFDAAARGKLSSTEVVGLGLVTVKKSQFKELILLDLKDNGQTIQRTAGGLELYEYQEPSPSLQWELLPGDSTVAGYKCQKARTSLHGRDYIAWYSPEINLPYGPYKFHGLPGLVLRVTDTQGHYDFVLEGFQQAQTYQPIYKWAKSDIVKTNRKKVRQIYKNYCADPASALMSSGAVMLSPETRANIKPRPYNPIELD